MHFREDADMSLCKDLMYDYTSVVVTAAALQGTPHETYGDPPSLHQILRQISWTTLDDLTTLRLVDLDLRHWSADMSLATGSYHMSFTHIEHLEIRRCYDQTFLKWLHACGVPLQPRKFIYIMREKDDRQPWERWTAKGRYHKEWKALLRLVQRFVRNGSQLESLGIQFPLKISGIQVEAIRLAMSTGTLFHSTSAPSIRDIVILLGNEELEQQDIDGLIAKCPNLRDPQAMGDKLSWSRLYDEPVIGDDEWAQMRTAPAAFWRTEDGDRFEYHGSSFGNEV